MRTYFSQKATRYSAIKGCPFTPSIVVRVFDGYMCFESKLDYKVWKDQK